LNKYFPPDYDPSKIKRRKGGKDPQMTIRLMAPFSMRCNKCGEYVWKGKKFNARKETAVGEEYYGIKIFRFYIKCTHCSSEITFKTDPKNADYVCEHGAVRNFENWTDADPNGKVGFVPDAAADDDYDSDGNLVENKQNDAMADLERSQEQSRREMELMDELSDLRQRNARMELSNANADPESLLTALHAERESAAEELKRKTEQDEDDAMVAQYFAKIPTTNGNGKGKGKEKAAPEDGVDGGSDATNSDDEDTGLPAALTVKRRPAPTVGSGSGGRAEPSVAALLAERAKATGAADPVVVNGTGVNPAQAKRKREGMQKLLGIKKKK